MSKQYVDGLLQAVNEKEMGEKGGGKSLERENPWLNGVLSRLGALEEAELSREECVVCDRDGRQVGRRMQPSPLVEPWSRLPG